jgi:integrase
VLTSIFNRSINAENNGFKHHKERGMSMANKGNTKDGIRFKASKGKFELRFTFEGKQYSVYGNTRTECKDKQITKLAKLKNGTYKNNNSVILDDYFKEWQKVKECKPNTLRSYISTYKKHISPAIGSVKVQKLERREIQNMIHDISKRVSVHTANYSLLVIKMILRDVVRDGIRIDNPAGDIKAIKTHKKNEAVNTIHRALSKEELRIFFEYAKDSIYDNFFRFMLYTGLRPSEVAALRYSDIDYKKNCIHVQRTVTYDVEGKIDTGSPKTYTSKRDVPLNEEAKNVLKRQQASNNILHNVVPIDSFIFTGINGNMIRRSSLDRGIARILKKASKEGHDIEYFSSHCFRDTFATECVEQGMQPHVLQKILGHKTLAMTMNLYYHLPEETKQEQMQKISFAV